MRKHINCFALNVSTGFTWSVYTLLNRKHSSWPAHDLCFLISCACLFSMCASCLCVTACGVRAMFLCVRLCTSHCALGKAIGRPGRVIKVKLLPPRLFLPAWWDNRRGRPSPLLFQTRRAFLSAPPCPSFWQLCPGFTNPIQTSGVGFHAKECRFLL